MTSISPELFVGLVIGGVLLLVVVQKLFPMARPKEKHFKCERCGSVAQHTERTIEAWRNKKTKFFCSSCHAKWLQSQPQVERDRARARGGMGARSGCFGVVLLLAILPVAAYFVVQSYV